MRFNPESLTNAIETLTLHNLGSSTGKEALVPGRISVVEISSNYRIENSVAQEFKPLIVGPTPVWSFHRHRPVYQSQFVILNVQRIEPCYAVNKNIKFLFLSEKELYD